jgi:hypothetical protein
MFLKSSPGGEDLGEGGISNIRDQTFLPHPNLLPMEK